MRSFLICDDRPCHSLGRIFASTHIYFALLNPRLNYYLYLYFQGTGTPSGIHYLSFPQTSYFYIPLTASFFLGVARGTMCNVTHWKRLPGLATNEIAFLAAMHFSSFSPERLDTVTRTPLLSPPTSSSKSKCTRWGKSRRRSRNPPREEHASCCSAKKGEIR
jgi:hypothetical protein